LNCSLAEDRPFSDRQRSNGPFGPELKAVLLEGQAGSRRPIAEVNAQCGGMNKPHDNRASPRLVMEEAGLDAQHRTTVVTLRVGDVAVFGRIRCAATTDARPPSSWKRGLLLHALFQAPLSLARYSTDIFRDAVSVWDVGAKEQLYVTPR
jgi:hypothetical protein